jgi:murein DD-endopeptidase MepM/ murein hydrolase activator NlpD
VLRPPGAPPGLPAAAAVVRGFEAPAGPFSPGHRGVDLALEPGTPVAALLDGTVTFAGPVAGALHVTVAHPGTPPLAVTWSFLSRIDVEPGQAVRAGDVLGATGPGHPGQGRPGVHLGLRLEGAYVDPAPLLGLAPGDVSGLVALGPLPVAPGSVAHPPGRLRPHAVRLHGAAPGPPARPSPRLGAAQAMLERLGRAVVRQAACSRAAAPPATPPETGSAPGRRRPRPPTATR